MNIITAGRESKLRVWDVNAPDKDPVVMQGHNLTVGGEALFLKGVAWNVCTQHCHDSGGGHSH